MEPEVLPRDQALTTQPQSMTPMAMIQLAVSQNADVDKLKQLMDLQERWERNEAHKAFVGALAAFKANPPEVLKSKEVSFGVGKTSYKHATLDNASDKIGKALHAHGLSHRWKVEQPEGGKIRVTCILTHVLGHSEEVTMEASPDNSGSKNSIQAVGSTVSYLQRYTLFSITGLAAKGDDDDGRGGVKGLDEKTVADYQAKIEELASIPAAEKLWQEIAAACQGAGDVVNYDTLKSAMAKKRKALNTPASKTI
jgi:hypothetical protein